MSKTVYSHLERYPGQDLFEKLFEVLHLDCWGYPEKGYAQYSDEEYDKQLDKKHDNKTVDNDLFLIRPYYWGDDDRISKRPNFEYKPLGLKITWYKYPLRGAMSNMPLSSDKISEILSKCIEYAQKKTAERMQTYAHV